MSTLEAPVHWYDHHWFVRLLEIFPGTISWLTLIAPIVLSFLAPIVVAYFIIAFDLYWTLKSFRLSVNLIRGYRRLHLASKVDWNERLEWIRDPNKYLAQTNNLIIATEKQNNGLIHFFNRMSPQKLRHKNLLQQRNEIAELAAHALLLLDPSDLYHAVILATSNESMDILEPSVRSLTSVNFPTKQIMLIIAYEERGGKRTEDNAKELIKRYGQTFAFAQAIKHPDGMVGEVLGKGGNITYAGRELARMVKRQGINPENVIVTTLDADHRPSKNYFSYLSYLYAADPNRIHKSFQPIPMFYNNIWDAPAAMRVIATGNSFWTLMETMRPHRLRNFAAHAQGLATLIGTDFWSVTTIVEDGHQFWRTYFAFDGDHQVVPVYAPIYQDAVLADGYMNTIRAQYKQLRRWAWGVSDFSYVVRQSIANKRIPWTQKGIELGRLFESHYSWATASITLTAVAWLPLTLNHQFAYQTLAQQLPIITSRILQVASIGIIVTILISLISLPPRPPRYRRSRSILMVAQWILLPVTSIVFGCAAALDAQTRLMIGKYLGFYVTEKSVKK